MIVKLGGLGHITTAIDSNFESVQRYACRTIYRLAAHQEIQAQCIDAGIIPALNKLCYVSSALVRKYAVMSICNISGILLTLIYL